jgi:hypothetical protein
MEKLKKSERVENYLEKLLEQEDFGLTQLESTKYKDFIDVNELKGIGDRTISNALNHFKAAKGIRPDKRKVTKKQLVEDYLTELRKSGQISHSELQSLRYENIKDEKELSGVGKTTLTCALAEFKKKHNKNNFEKGILDFLANEKVTTDDHPGIANSITISAPTAELICTHDFLLNIENIKWIKKMIQDFEKRATVDEEKQVFELRELKHALHFVGINPKKIIRKYWEDVSKDFMNQKILSGNTVKASEFQVKSYMQN